MPYYRRKYQRKSASAYRRKRSYKRRYSAKPSYRRRSYKRSYAKTHKCSCKPKGLEGAASKVVKCVRKYGQTDPSCAVKAQSYLNKYQAFHPRVSDRVNAAQRSFNVREHIKQYRKNNRPAGPAPAAGPPPAGGAGPYDFFQAGVDENIRRAEQQEAEFQAEEDARRQARGGPRVDEPMDV